MLTLWRAGRTSGAFCFRRNGGYDDHLGRLHRCGRRGGRVYDRAPVYVFGDLAQACMHLAVNPQHIDQTRGEATLPRIDAPTLTPDGWARGVGTS